MNRLNTQLASLVSGAIFWFLPSVALAATEAENELREGLNKAAGEAGFGTTATPIYTIVGNLINVVFGLIGILFLGLLLYAGFLYLTSMGETEPIGKAKKIFSSSIIGLLVTVGAYAIATYVFAALGTVFQ